MLSTSKTDVAIALAIHQDLDIVEALPAIQTTKIEDIEKLVEEYIFSLQDKLSEIIMSYGEDSITQKDPDSLCSEFMKHDLRIPFAMLLKMSQTIIDCLQLESRHIINFTDKTDPSFFKERSLWYVKMNVEFILSPEPHVDRSISSTAISPREILPGEQLYRRGNNRDGSGETQSGGSGDDTRGRRSVRRKKGTHRKSSPKIAQENRSALEGALGGEI